MSRINRLALTGLALLLLAAAGVAAWAARRPAAPESWITAAVDRGPILVTVAGIGAVEGPRGRSLRTLIPEPEVDRLKTGQPTLISVDTWPERDLTGAVTLIEPGKNGLAEVVITLDAGEPDLPGGTAAWVRIVTDRRENALRVPYVALLFQPEAPDAPANLPTSGDGKAFAAQALGEIVEQVKRDLPMNAEQSRAADRIAADLAAAAAPGLTPETDPATLRERVHALRRNFLKRIAGVLQPGQQMRFADLVARRMKRGGREQGQAGRLHVLRDGGHVETLAVHLGAMNGLFTELVGAPIEAGTRVVVSRRPQPVRASLAERLMALLPGRS